MYNQIKSLANSNNYKKSIQLLTELIESQDKLIVEQNRVINQLHKRITALEQYNQLTQKVVDPVIDEIEPEVRSLNDMLVKSYESDN